MEMEDDETGRMSSSAIDEEEDSFHGMMPPKSSGVNAGFKVEMDDQSLADPSANDKEHDQLEPQQDDNTNEETPLPKLRPKRGGRKGRIKRKKKERASRQLSSSDVQVAANFTFMRKRRQDLTLGAKIKVLEMLDHEPKVAQGRIASVFRVSQSQVSRIMKNKEAIMSQWNRFATPERKRCRLGKAGALEQKLVDWYKEARKIGLPISGPILMEKAKSIGVEMGIDFKPSAGWLGRWKDRNGVTLKVFQEKDGTPSITKVANHWRRYMFAKATKDIPYQNVWVVDETVLAYNSVPDFMMQRISSGNDKISVILACNLAGTERRSPVVVGSLQALEYLSLPVSYYYHTRAKITLDCFSSWLHEWDRELRVQKKKIVILLNKAAHHPENLHFFNINITYFPMGTAKVLQPLQLGIISSFKALYRHQQLKLMYSKGQANELMVHANMLNHSVMATPSSFTQGVSTLDAVYIIYKAWKHVSPETVVKGAVKAGLSKDVDALKVYDYVTAPPGINQQDFDAFVNTDVDFLCVEDQEETEKLDGAHAVIPVSNQYQNYANMANAAHGNQSQQQNNQQIDSSTIETMPALPKVSEAVFACQVIRRYLQQLGGRLFDEFSELESAIQMDMILETRPDLKNEAVGDPFHDHTSVHSLHAHKQAESAKLEYLQRVQSALEQKNLQKEMKKAAQASAPSLPPDSGTIPVSTPTQDIRSGIINQPVDVQRCDHPGQELPRQDMIQQEMQPPVQRHDLIPQEMIRPEYRQDIPVDRPRAALFEMRPVNMSTIYRPVQPSARNDQTENKNGTLSVLPTDLRTLPLPDPRTGAATHHPAHANELSQNIRQPDARLENPGIPYYTVHNPLHHCLCGNAECSS